MGNYLKLLRDVTNYGWETKGRTKEKYYSLNALTYQHYMGDGFPAITTKKLAFKTMLVELEGFINGITDKRWYQERGCHIWDEWSNPTNDDDNDLGPIYGAQWRSFGPDNVDQLQNIIDSLKFNRSDRRMVCSAWNPSDQPYMALPPCHFAWGVNAIDGDLNLNWVQRSCDMFLGLPFNIASYATLLHLLALEADMVEGTLSGFIFDGHVYDNHLDQCWEQLRREPYPEPQIETNWKGSIFDWTHEDTKLVDYEHHPAIKGDVAV